MSDSRVRLPQELLATQSPPHVSRRAHLVGAAGAGMRALAEVLHGAGWRLTGSDRNAGGIQNLESFIPTVAHDAALVDRGLDVVVHSSAIALDMSELQRAASLGIPVLSYPQALGQMMSERRGLAVAGTHGKSTTAAMLAEILIAGGFDPLVVAGGVPLGQTSGGRFGRGDWLVAEACEYQANFLQLQPEAAAILGIEPDHFDYFRSRAQLDNAFQQFAGQVSGLLLTLDSCSTSLRLAHAAAARHETFGVRPGSTWQAAEPQLSRGRYCFELRHRGVDIGAVRLRVPGRHNVLNALAAAGLAHHAGASYAAICRGIERFAGIHRRLELLGEHGGIALVDDFAHHPTEIAASLKTVRQLYPGRRLWCVFQPHQVSRTARLLDSLAASLQNADKLVVAEIYSAREAARPGDVCAADLAERAAALGADVVGLRSSEPIDGASEEEIGRMLAAGLRPGDVLITVGAGDIGKLAHAIVKRFRENRAAG